MKPDEVEGIIRNQADFVLFLRRFELALLDNPAWWQNNDLPSFLNALWGKSQAFHGKKLEGKEWVPIDNPWATFAYLLMAATMYD